MLSDRWYRLLTAYVDGELGARQCERVVRLLDKSPEAQALLQRLQDDAARLRQLPRRSLDENFSRRVLRSIAERDMQPARQVAATLGPNIAAWAGLAAAACVLFVVGVSAYLYFDAAQDWGRDILIVHEPPSVRDKFEAILRHEEIMVTKPEEPSKPGTVEVAQGVEPKSSPPELPADSAQPKPSSSELGILNPKMERFEVIDNPRLLILAVRQLDQPKPAGQLQHELQRESTHRLDLFCLDSTKAFDRLQAAFKVHGIRLLIDQDAQLRLKQRLKTNYALYADDLLPDELLKILQQLGRDDKKAEEKRAGDGQFGKMVVNPLTDADQKELAELLGVDPTQIQPKRKTPLGVDIRKPLSETTAEQVAQALTGPPASRPEPGKSAAVKAPERRALVLAYNPVRPKPAASKEVKQFLDSRKERRAGTLQLLLVLRNANG